MSEQPTSTATHEAPSPAAPSAGAGLPAVVPQAPQPAPRRLPRWLPLLLGLAVAGAGAGWWWTHRPAPLPPWIAFSNGRLEADEIDIDTKFAGRIAELMVDEGDIVRPGEVVARMDTRDLAASLKQAEATIVQARHTVDQTQSDLVQAATQVKLASQELLRARTLVPHGFQTQEVLDQRQQQYDGAVAAYHATEAKLAADTAALEADEHSAELIRVNIADNTLVTPKPGRIEYRLANVGEVLPAGGKVFTMLDATYVYMDIFLPTAEAGRVRLGAPARIVLDALPGRPIPASVTFVAAQNQFTPKMVETKEERDKLMFRIRVRIDPVLLAQHVASVRSGLPGLAYVLLDAKAAWPVALRLPAER